MDRTSLKIVDFGDNKKIEVEGLGIIYYDESNDLFFDDFYVPFSHQCREQVSILVGHDIKEFSEYVHNFRYNTGFEYHLKLLAYNFFIEKVKKNLEDSMKVLIVDMSGIFVDDEESLDKKNPNLIYVDAKTLKSGDIIQKYSNEKIEKCSSSDKRVKLQKKYRINKDFDENDWPDFDVAYVLDDVYTTGDTVNWMKELIYELDFSVDKVETYCIAKTTRYKINDFMRKEIMSNGKTNVLFVCECNMTRSILAESIAKTKFPGLEEKYNFFSVGIKPWAGRQICDKVLNYIIENELYSDDLISERLMDDTNLFGKIIGSDWKIICLEKSILVEIIYKYDIDEKQIICQQMVDVCRWKNPDETKNSFFGNVKKLAEDIESLIRRELIGNDK